MNLFLMDAASKENEASKKGDYDIAKITRKKATDLGISVYRRTQKVSDSLLYQTVMVWRF